MKKYNCPCCGNFTLTESPPGTYEICPLCGWEDNELQFLNPNLANGANSVSLNENRKRYIDKISFQQDTNSNNENDITK